MYNSVEELLERAKTENKRLHEVIAQNEMSISDISEEMLYDDWKSIIRQWWRARQRR